MIVLGQLNFRFKPKVGFTISGYYMNVRSRLFPGKEKEPITSDFEYGRTHIDVLSAMREV